MLVEELKLTNIQYCAKMKDLYVRLLSVSIPNILDENSKTLNRSVRLFCCVYLRVGLSVVYSKC